MQTYRILIRRTDYQLKATANRQARKNYRVNIKYKVYNFTGILKPAFAIPDVKFRGELDRRPSESFLDISPEFAETNVAVDGTPNETINWCCCRCCLANCCSRRFASCCSRSFFVFDFLGFGPGWKRPPSPRLRLSACWWRDSWRYFWEKKIRISQVHSIPNFFL